MDCLTGIGGLFSQLVQRENRNIASETLHKKCGKCNFSGNTVHAVIPIRPADLDLKNLINFVHSTCKNELIVKKRLNDIIAFEVEQITKNIRKDAIRDVSQNIIVDGIHFALFGVIECQSRIHFVAHVKRRNGDWECIDDIKSEKIESSITDPICICMLFYIRESLITAD